MSMCRIALIYITTRAPRSVTIVGVCCGVSSNRDLNAMVNFKNPFSFVLCTHLSSNSALMPTSSLLMSIPSRHLFLGCHTAEQNVT